MKLRNKLVNAELAAARLHIREVGGNNHGPEVKKFLAEVGLPEGYAWCDAFQSYEMHAAAGRRLPIESASVFKTFTTARSLGWLVASPARGDLVLYDFDGDGQTDDHIGIVTGVSSVPGGWKLNTVEGNTGDGSAADGDGVYVRTRIARKGSVAFVRIPGDVPDVPDVPAPPKKKSAPAKKEAPPTLRKGARGPWVRVLQRKLAKTGARVAVDGVFGYRTLASVTAFQRRAKLPATGIVNAKTWAALDKAGSKR